LAGDNKYSLCLIASARVKAYLRRRAQADYSAEGWHELDHKLRSTPDQLDLFAARNAGEPVDEML